VTSRRAAVSTLFFAAVAQGLLSVPFSASAHVLRARGLSDAEYGSLFVPLVTLAALGAVGAGFLIEKLGARHSLGVGYVFMGLSQLELVGVVVVPPGAVYGLTLAGAATLGLGMGLCAGPLSAYPQVLFPARSESAVIALHTVIGLGLAASPLLCGFALSGRIWPVYPLGLLVAAGACALALFREELPEPEPRVHGAPPLPRPVGAGVLWLFLAVTVLYGTAESVFGNWAIPFLTEERGLGAAAAGVALASFWAALSAGRISVAALVTRVAPGPVLPLLAAAMAAAALVVPAASGARGAVLVFALGGLGCSAVFPLTVGLACARFPEHRTWVSGVMYAGLCAGLGIGSLSAGLLRASFALETIYRMAAGAPALAAVLAAAAVRGEAPPGAPVLPPVASGGV
jgi:predicted MFS family arabinose efflux permease